MYHPGIRAIMYFLTQYSDTLIIKADMGYNGNPCLEGQELFSNEANYAEFKLDLDRYSSIFKDASVTKPPNYVDGSSINIRSNLTSFLGNTTYVFYEYRDSSY